MDLWAQHKDFILKALAGFGVFLVALIARGITYGDELEEGQSKNKRLASKIAGMSIVPISKIATLENQADRLSANALAIASEIGWNAGEESLELRLITATLRYLRKYRGASAAEIKAAGRDALDAIRAELNGGFGQLRLTVQDELVGEANEKNIRIDEGLGFDHVIQLDAGELVKYLLQLEVTARVVRYCIGVERTDPRAIAVLEVNITSDTRGEVIPGANPDFLQEYPVRFRFIASQVATARIFNKLETERQRVPWRKLRIERLQRPADHLGVDLLIVPMAVNPAVAFVPEEAE